MTPYEVHLAVALNGHATYQLHMNYIVPQAHEDSGNADEH